MKISSETINILKNFSGINANLVFKPGKELKTISEAKTIMANASILEDFPQQFGVYDLNEFLSLYNLMDEPDLEFSEKYLTMSDGSQKIKYYYSEIDILTQPSKDINMPECEVVLDLSMENLLKIQKAAAVLGHSELSFIKPNQMRKRDWNKNNNPLGAVNKFLKSSKQFVIDKIF